LRELNQLLEDAELIKQTFESFIFPSPDVEALSELTESSVNDNFSTDTDLEVAHNINKNEEIQINTKIRSCDPIRSFQFLSSSYYT
jgi:hypothetical protein